MKKLLLSLSLLVVSLSSVMSQNVYPNLKKYSTFVKPKFNSDSIEYEFVKIYLEHSKKIGNYPVYSKELDSAVTYHLRYLKQHIDFNNVDKNTYTGENNLHYEKPSNMRSPTQRIAKLNPSLIFNYGAEVASILSLYADNNGLYKTKLRTNKDIALYLWNSLINSEPHKEIIENPTLKHFSFGILIVDNNYIVVGDFY